MTRSSAGWPLRACARLVIKMKENRDILTKCFAVVLAVGGSAIMLAVMVVAAVPAGIIYAGLWLKKVLGA